MNQSRILAIAPSSRGFGYAVMEGPEQLVGWGVKSVKGEDKNQQSLAKVEKIITRYQPDLLVLQDASAKGSRRSTRIKALTWQIITLAADRQLKVKLLSNPQINQFFFADAEGTKQARAEMVAQRFPQELALELPPKRRSWESEDARMDIFDAVALAIVQRQIETQGS